MNNKKTVSLSFGSFPSLLTILFIGLKLCNKITWSWWWVVSPIWIPGALFISFIIVWLLLLIILALFN